MTKFQTKYTIFSILVNKRKYSKLLCALHGPKSAHTRTASRSKGQSLGSVRPRLPSLFIQSFYIYKEIEKHKRGDSTVVAAVSLELKVASSNPSLCHFFNFYHFNSAIQKIKKSNAKDIDKPVSIVVVGKEFI